MKKQSIAAALSGALLLLFILDAKTVYLGAKSGIELCLYTVIPSLFPLFVINTLFSASIFGTKVPLLRRVGVLCNIPEGGESIFLLSLVSGYPIGAKIIGDCHSTGLIDKATAARMVGFCNNCGPAFIFGISGHLFTKRSAVWLLWAIQILSALLTGIILPRNAKSTAIQIKKNTISVRQSLKSSLHSIAEVCGWVTLFRVFITISDRWVLWYFPEISRIVFTGILELTNGCTTLSRVADEGLRFILCSCFLSFGGICVLMQTLSVTGTCGLGWYIPGKLLQTAISCLMSFLCVWVLYSLKQTMLLPFIIAIALLAALLFIHKNTEFLIKKDGNNSKSIV